MVRVSMSNEQERRLHIEKVPTPVLLAFKSWCAARGVTMRHTIIRYMAEAVKKP